MDLVSSAVVYPPNKPLERVRVYPTEPVLHNYSFFVEIDDNENVLLGSSDISGSYWEGILFQYQTISEAVSHKYSNYYISETTTSDAKFVKNTDCIVLAEDSGQLKVLDVGKSKNGDIKCIESFNNEGRVRQIATWDNDFKVLTCCNKSLCIWDIKNNSTGYPLKSYSNYHTEDVLSIDTDRSHNNIFASTGMDRRVCLWDDRLDSPAQILYENEFSSLNALSWSKRATEELAVGSDGGDIYLLDTRYPKEFTKSFHCFNSGIHRSVFNAKGYLAVCGQISDIMILDCRTTITINNKIDAHNSVTRGLAWCKSTLYSCGYDNEFSSHVVV